MADILKVLGQAIPAANTLVDIFTAPLQTMFAFVACNQNNAATKFRMSIAVGGAADTPKQYVYFDESIAATATTATGVQFVLAAGDVVRVRSANGQVSFQIVGIERQT